MEKQNIGRLLRLLGIIIFIISFLIALTLSIGLIIRTWGFLFGIIAILCFPAVLVIYSWYALFAHHYWYPVVAFYIGCTFSLLLIACAGRLIHKK